MSLMDLSELYESTILDHGKNPRNCGCDHEVSHEHEGFNPICGDKVTIFINVDPTNSQIKQISFEGEGCAISMASASLMTEKLNKMNKNDAVRFIEDFINMLTHDQEPPKKLGKIMALQGVKAFPARIKCATLSAHTVLEALRKEAINAD